MHSFYSRYVTREFYVDVIRWTGYNKDDIKKFCGSYCFLSEDNKLAIETAKGPVEVKRWNFVLIDPHSEFLMTIGPIELRRKYRQVVEWV